MARCRVSAISSSIGQKRDCDIPQPWTPVYFQGISPPIKAVIRDIPLDGKRVAVFATCGGFYGSFMHWFVKRSIRSRGGIIDDLFVVKVGGKTDEEIEEQASIYLKSILNTE